MQEHAVHTVEETDRYCDQHFVHRIGKDYIPRILTYCIPTDSNCFVTSLGEYVVLTTEFEISNFRLTQYNPWNFE